MTDYNPTSSRSDTGLWHLTVEISDHGLTARLNLKESPAESPRTLVETSWPADRDGLMQKIENTVYDHPEVLDDYSATIIVESSRTLIVPPTEITEEGDAERLYSMVYTSEEEDVMTDDTGKETILFTLAPGMISFLQRTFPGARIRSHLGLLIEKTRNMGTGLRVFLNLRHGWTDVVALNGNNLLSGSVQTWKEWTDLAYRILNLLDIYQLPSEECEVIISGASDNVFDSLASFLNNRCAAVRKINQVI